MNADGKERGLSRFKGCETVEVQAVEEACRAHAASWSHDSINWSEWVPPNLDRALGIVVPESTEKGRPVSGESSEKPLSGVSSEKSSEARSGGMDAGTDHVGNEMDGTMFLKPRRMLDDPDGAPDAFCDADLTNPGFIGGIPPVDTDIRKSKQQGGRKLKGEPTAGTKDVLKSKLSQALETLKAYEDKVRAATEKLRSNPDFTVSPPTKVSQGLSPEKSDSPAKTVHTPRDDPPPKDVPIEPPWKPPGLPEAPQASVGGVKPDIPLPPPVKKGRGPDKRPRKPRQNKGPIPGVRKGAVAAQKAANADGNRLLEPEGDVESFFTLPEVEKDEEILEIHAFLGVAEALKSADAPEWIESMKKEWDGLVAKDVWVDASAKEIAAVRETGGRILPLAWVLVKKRCGKLKSRLVVLGHLQKVGDVETYSPTASMSTTRSMLTWACHHGWDIRCGDIEQAFLQAPVNSKVIIELPKTGPIDQPGARKRLTRALYGLRSSPRDWYVELSKWLDSQQWESNPFEPSIRRKLIPSAKATPVHARTSKDFVWIVIYVDDLIWLADDKSALDEEFARLAERWTMKTIPGKKVNKNGVSWTSYDILGTDLLWGNRRMELSSKNFIEKMSQQWGYTQRPVGRIKEVSPEFDETILWGCIQEWEKAGKKPCTRPYKWTPRGALGKLSWLASTTRPEIAVGTQTLSKYIEWGTCPAVLTAIEKILWYIVKTPDKGISYSPQKWSDLQKEVKTYSGRTDMSPITAYADASFASDPRTRKSHTGILIMMYAVPVAWSSQRQTINTFSTTESETAALSSLIEYTNSLRVLHWLTGQTEWGKTDLLMCDNSAAIQLARKDCTSMQAKSRHFHLKYLRIREEAGRLQFCPTKLQRADCLTKCSRTMDAVRLLHGEGLKGSEIAKSVIAARDGELTNFWVQCGV